MILRLRGLGVASITAGLLVGCSGGGNVAQVPSVGNTGPTTSGSSSITQRDALATARRGDSFHANLPVTPSSLALALPTPQTLTVTVKRKTVVFAASSDEKIATISPNYVDVAKLTSGVGTATFTVTPKAIGTAKIGLINLQGMYAVVPVAVSKPVGASKIYVVGFSPVYTFNAKDGTPTGPEIYTGYAEAAGIAVDANGKIYTANQGQGGSGNVQPVPGGVTTYNPDGSPTTPTINVGTSSATSVAIGATGKIYVVYGDSYNQTVGTFNADGSASTPTIAFGSSPPAGIAVDAAGKIFVAELIGANEKLVTYNADGTFASPTIALPNLDHDGIAVDAAGKIYVADTTDSKILTFLPDGTPTTPTIVADVNGPASIAVDAAGTIYVGNLGNQTISVYNADGSRAYPPIQNVIALGIAVH